MNKLSAGISSDLNYLLGSYIAIDGFSLLIVGVYFELDGEVYKNNSVVSISDIGEGDEALLCKTDKVECCGTIPNRFGEFYYPNGVGVPIRNQQQGFYRNRGEKQVRLNRRRGIVSPTGVYRCEIPDSNNVMQKLFVNIRSES
jgi:hypothetical protein